MHHLAANSWTHYLLWKIISGYFIRLFLPNYIYSWHITKREPFPLTRFLEIRNAVKILQFESIAVGFVDQFPWHKVLNDLFVVQRFPITRIMMQDTPGRGLDYFRLIMWLLVMWISSAREKVCGMHVEKVGRRNSVELRKIELIQ